MKITIPPQTKILSTDVFDTLLFRTLEKPADLFPMVYEQAAGEGRVLGEGIRVGDFVKSRMLAESNLYKQGKNPTLEDIYEMMPEAVVTNRAKCLEIELACEMQCCYRNDDLYELIKAVKDSSKQVVILSDMYLTKPNMIRLLEVCGVDTKLFDEIFVSCDLNATKKSGGLYDVLTERFGVAPEEIYHLGDNAESDIAAAEEKGVKACFVGVREHTDPFLTMEKEMEPLVPELLSLRKKVSYEIENLPASAESKLRMQYGADVLGPFYTGATKWLLKTCREHEMNHLFLLMREGKFFKLMVDQHLEYEDLDLSVSLFYSSRNALFLPGQQLQDENLIDSALAEFKKQLVTVYGAYELLGIPEEFPECLNEHRNIKVRELTKDESARLRELLSREGCRRKIDSAIENSRRNCLRYIENTGLTKGNVAVLDLGYKGSAQRFLDRMTGHNALNLLYIGKSEVDEALKLGHHFEGFLSTCGNDEAYINRVLNAGAPFEGILMRGDGCTVGYTEEGQPIQSPVENIPKEQFEQIKEIHEGILMFQREYLRTCRGKGPEAQMGGTESGENRIEQALDRPEALFRILGRSFLNPCLAEVKILAPILNEENFGTSAARDVYLPAVEKEEQVACLKSRNQRIWKMGTIVNSRPLYYLKSRAAVDSRFDDLALMEQVEELWKSGRSKAVIVGAGVTGRKVMDYCRLIGVKVIGFMDNNEAKHGSRYQGLMVHRPGDDLGSDTAYVIASIKYKAQLTQQFEELYGNRVF